MIYFLSLVTHRTTIFQILKACEEMKIEVSYDLPQVDEMEHWGGAFISSTSRLLLPIDLIHLHEPNKKDVKINNSTVIHELRQRVSNKLVEEATAIL